MFPSSGRERTRPSVGPGEARLQRQRDKSTESTKDDGHRDNSGLDGSSARTSVERAGRVRVSHGGDAKRIVGSIDVRLGADRKSAAISTLDGDRLDGSLEMSVGDLVRVVPVDHASGPVNGALTRGRNTCRPDTELDTRWCRRVLCAAVGTGVGSGGTIKASDFFAVDEEFHSVLLPVNRVVVVSIERVREALGREAVVGRVVRNNTHPEVVGLSLSCHCTRPLPINLVTDVRHSDECRYNTLPHSRLHAGGDGAIMDIVGE